MEMAKARTFALLAALLFSWGIAAQTLNPDAPDRYIVQDGDTLWGIAGQFLREPWRWTDVWEANPQIEDPHLIYPGDEIVLVQGDGGMVLRANRDAANGRPTIKLSPTVRAYTLDTAIPTIPIDAIQQFLVASRVMNAETLDSAPYVVSVGNEALLARPGEKFFARGIDTDTHTQFTVLRKGQPYFAPESGELLGHEAVHVGDAVLHTVGDPATLYMIRLKREVLVGDRLLPVMDDEVRTHFFPRPPDNELTGQIIAVVDGVTQIGQHNIVVLDLGREHGIEAGHVLSVFQTGATVNDEIAIPPEFDPVVGRRHLDLDPEKQGGVHGALQAADDGVSTMWNYLTHFAGRVTGSKQEFRTVQLPDTPAGTVMVFQPFDRLSYALVMDASRTMHVHDAVRNPD